MDTNEYLILLEAVRKTGPPMDAFIAVNKSINPDRIKIHSLLLELLHFKKFAGTGEESPYGHLQFFEDVCGSFMFDNCKLDKVKIQLFIQTLI